MIERSFTPDGPLDLLPTMKGLSSWGTCPSLRVRDGEAWYAERTAAGPATVRLVSDAGRVRASAFGPGAEDLLGRVPVLLGLDRPPPAAVGGHPVIQALSDRFVGVRTARTGRVFEALVPVVLAQKVTGKESALAVKRLARAWGEPAPGPGPELWLLPEPKALGRRSYAELHPLGVERRRAEVLLEVARRANRLEAAAALPMEEADTLLRHVRGIGPWTTGVVLGDALGHADAVPVGDYHLPNLVSWNLAGEPRADDARMLELLEPWRGSRGRVVRLLTLGGAGAPRWGPRSEARDIRGL